MPLHLLKDKVYSSPEFLLQSPWIVWNLTCWFILTTFRTDWILVTVCWFSSFGQHFDLMKQVYFVISGHFLENAREEWTEIWHFDVFWPSSELQSSIVIARSNIPWYCTHHCRNGGRILIRVWTHKRHPIPRPNGWAIECLLWIFWKNLTAS